MKKRVKKLALSKETVVDLGVREIEKIAGGITVSLCAKVCDSWYDCSGTTSGTR